MRTALIGPDLRLRIPVLSLFRRCKVLSIEDKTADRESSNYKAIELSSDNVALITTNLMQFLYCQH